MCFWCLKSAQKGHLKAFREVLFEKRPKNAFFVDFLFTACGKLAYDEDACGLKNIVPPKCFLGRRQTPCLNLQEYVTDDKELTHGSSSTHDPDPID